MTLSYEKEITHLSHEKSRLMEEIDRLNTECQLIREATGGQLAAENTQLRGLLMGSSAQLEASKTEMMMLAKQNGSLLLEVGAAEKEAKSWQESYYLLRSRAY